MEARRARGAVKRCLQRGGSCYVSVEGTKRIALHDRFLHEAQLKLPWPLSLLLPHTVAYAEYVEGSNVPTEQRNFNRSELDLAVGYFLRGLDPSEEVVVMPDQGH